MFLTLDLTLKLILNVIFNLTLSLNQNLTLTAVKKLGQIYRFYYIFAPKKGMGLEIRCLLLEGIEVR